jgi:hypothetical protein
MARMSAGLWVGAGVAVVAGAALVSQSARSPRQTTLPALFDTCATFAETGDVAALAALDLTLPSGATQIGLPMAVPEGGVMLRLRATTAGDPPVRCLVEGFASDDPDGVPTVTWGKARPVVEAWFAARSGDPDRVQLHSPAEPETLALAVCPPSGAGFTLNGGSCNVTNDLTVEGRAAQALRFQADRSADAARLACRMVAQASGG